MSDPLLPGATIPSQSMRSITGKRVDANDLTALKHFAEDYPQAKRYVIYRGEDRLNRDGILCIPAERFLLELKPGDFPT